MRRRHVPFAECAGGVTVLTQDLYECGGFLGDDAVVAGECTGTFGNVAHVHCVMIATSKHRCACG